MENKYLLYIDILGFEEMVRNHNPKIEVLYKIIASLNAHRHHAFNTIVFSDTILIYNKETQRNAYDHNYDVMFLCEFAQDLMYRLKGKDIYFRAIIRYGEFRHILGEVQFFYGNALIDSYRKEKQIKCIGLFMDESCIQKNNIFPTEAYEEGLYFVFLNRGLDSLWSEWVATAGLPAHPIFFESDVGYRLVDDIKMLQNTYEKMNTHPNPDVRAKFRATWELFRTRYQPIIDVLVESGFDLETICADIDWTVYNVIEDGE